MICTYYMTFERRRGRGLYIFCTTLDLLVEAAARESIPIYAIHDFGLVGGSGRDTVPISTLHDLGLAGEAAAR